MAIEDGAIPTEMLQCLPESDEIVIEIKKLEGYAEIQRATMKRPEFSEVLDFYKKGLELKGYSTKLAWLFRENIIVQPERRKYKFLINPKANSPNDNIELIYNELRRRNWEIFVYTFITLEEQTYVTIAGDDYDFEESEGDIDVNNWGIKFGFGDPINTEKAEIEFVTSTTHWKKLMKKESSSIGPFDYFYLAKELLK